MYYKIVNIQKKNKIQGPPRARSTTIANISNNGAHSLLGNTR